MSLTMPVSRAKKIVLTAAVAALLVAGLLFARIFSSSSPFATRQQLLQLIPQDSTAVIFLDLDQFKNSPFLAQLYSWAPHPGEDSEYAQFVQETGFSYERDLKRAVVAISNEGSDKEAKTHFLVVADGKFDRKKIESFLSQTVAPAQQGKWKVYSVISTSHDKPLSLAFLSDDRIVITDAGNFPATLASRASETARAEWNTHFDRLAGTPLFAVIRQDPSIENALNSARSGGFRSPQLSALLEQLQWISIAGKPDGDQLRVVSEGECRSEQSASQLRDFLEGILLLAQNGLHDPKLRQQMNPEARDAYLEILKSAEIQKIDRGEWKSVRAVLAITPKFLEIARTTSIVTPELQISSPQKTEEKRHGGKRSTPGGTKAKKKN
jgi:hypothetical protein